MKAKNQRVALHGGTVVVACLGLVFSTAAFRCPGPDPQAAPTMGGGGSGGATTETSTSATTTSTVTVASSSTGCAADVMNDPFNCGACGRMCNPIGTMGLSCWQGVCNSPCLPGFFNFKQPQAGGPMGGPDDGCEAHTHRVFITSMTFTSNMNGMSGGAHAGDAICESIAMGNPNLGGPFPWMAWLSDDTTSPATRFNKDGGPYVRIDMMPIADNWTGLTSSPLLNSINLDETGMPVTTGAQAWTGTGADGNVTKPPNPLNQMPATNCLNWSSDIADGDIGIFGSAWSTDSTWTSIVPQGPNCITDVFYSLYCFEQ